MNTVTRFAPSPTGYLHLGNIRTALFNALWAYHNEGRFLLRIEDTDLARSSGSFVEAIREDLDWLGLGQGGGNVAIVRQSERFALHRHYISELACNGGAYPCFCTEERLRQLREKQRLTRQVIGYDGHCRHLSASTVKSYQLENRPYHLRFRTPNNEVVVFDDLIKGKRRFETKSLGDFVIQRSDGQPVFLCCNAIDDALMGITHVLRGEDHVSNTAKQLLLLKSVRLKPPLYGHFPLISGQSSAQPLSKRDHSFSLRSLRQRGYLPQAIINYLVRLGYTITSDKLMSLKELASLFFIEKVHQSAAHFDNSQLDYWQKKTVFQQSAADFWNTLSEASRQAIAVEKRLTFIEVIRPMVVLPAEADSWANILFTELDVYAPEAREAICRANTAFWSGLLVFLQQMPTNTTRLLSGRLKAYMNTQDKGMQKVGWKAIRAALTDRLAGPEIVSLVALLGVAEATKRLERATLLQLTVADNPIN